MLAGSRSEHTCLRISLSMLSLSWSMKVDALVLVVVDVEYPVFSLTHSTPVQYVTTADLLSTHKSLNPNPITLLDQCGRPRF